MEPIINSPHSWYVNNFKVRLLQEHDSLAYETINTINGNFIYKESFDEYLKITPMEQLISSLKNRRVMIKDNGSAAFSYHYLNSILDDKEINLIRGTDDLI
ncbi:MAG TPA: hypothetical protein PLC42_04220 [Parachlamydiaceae bacterium]|nr:hypothetical protein [Parachlamydiaceae bacterium]